MEKVFRNATPTVEDFTKMGQVLLREMVNLAEKVLEEETISEEHKIHLRKVYEQAKEMLQKTERINYM